MLKVVEGDTNAAEPDAQSCSRLHPPHCREADDDVCPCHKLRVLSTPREQGERNSPTCMARREAASACSTEGTALLQMPRATLVSSSVSTSSHFLGPLICRRPTACYAGGHDPLDSGSGFGIQSQSTMADASEAAACRPQWGRTRRIISTWNSHKNPLRNLICV